MKNNISQMNVLSPKFSSTSPDEIRTEGQESALSNSGIVKCGQVLDFSCPHSFNMDDMLDTIREYPKFLSYFTEKVTKINRLQFLLDNKNERAKGETAAFLRHWILYFNRQIQNTTNWLLKKDKNNG